MFGTAPRTHRPVLLILVFGAFLAIVGITAASQSTIVSSNFDAVALSTVVGGDATEVQRYASSELQRADVTAGTTVSGVRSAQLSASLDAMAARDGILRIDLHRADGTLITSSTSAGGSIAAPSADGQSEAIILSAVDAGLAGLGRAMLLRERLPITDQDGKVLAVATVVRDAAPILAQLDAIRWQVIAVTVSAAAVASVLLFFIFRSAQRRLTRQTRQLLDATRTDALTGTLNHGALVDELARRIEANKDDGRPIGVALIDLDNFTLLNDHHGPAVGDDALLTVLDLLDGEMPPGAVLGRYGPDEFLVIVDADAVHELEPAVDRLRNSPYRPKSGRRGPGPAAGHGERRDRGPPEGRPTR